MDICKKCGKQLVGQELYTLKIYENLLPSLSDLIKWRDICFNENIDIEKNLGDISILLSNNASSKELCFFTLRFNHNNEKNLRFKKYIYLINEEYYNEFLENIKPENILTPIEVAQKELKKIRAENRALKEQLKNAITPKFKVGDECYAPFSNGQCLCVVKDEPRLLDFKDNSIRVCVERLFDGYQLFIKEDLLQSVTWPFNKK